MLNSKVYNVGKKVCDMDWFLNQRMTYYVTFIILKKDYLVVKKIGNRPITEADTDFSKMSIG